jgi:Domain of unknown function (DUF4279)
MKSERAFATFRIAGDNLVPDQVTKLLGLQPTLAYAKGQSYKRSPKRPELIGRTGIWYYSTDTFKSSHLADHLKLLLSQIALDHPERRNQLKRLLERNSLRAVMTFFWAGPAGAKPPSIPNQVVETLKSIPVDIERDFDTDYDPPSHKPIFIRA